MDSRNALRALASAVAVALATPALAEGSGAGGIYTKETYPDALNERPLTLPSGTFELTLPVTVNLSQDLVGKPVSIGPSLFYGITQDVTIGIYHPVGLCLTGESNGCAKVYDDVGAAALVSLYRGGNYQLIGQARLEFDRLSDPIFLQGQVGLGAKATFGPAALAAQAVFGFGITNRDQGNVKQLVAIELDPQLEIVHGLAIEGRIAFIGFVGDDARPFGDTYAIPVGIGVEVTPIHNLDIGVRLEFPNLLGKGSTADEREGTVFARARF